MNAPQALGDRLVELVRARDLDAIVELHESEVVVRVDPDELLRGHDGVRESFRDLLELSPELENEVLLALEGDGIALTISKWKLSYIDDDGPTEREGIGIEVLRAQPDGSWRLVIDNAIGLDGLG